MDVSGFRSTQWAYLQHTTCHRGQVATRLRERGAEPPLTEFIAWIWMRRPAPDRGSRAEVAT